MSAFPKVIYALNAIPIKFSYDFCGYCQGACQMHIRMQNTKNLQVNFEEEKKTVRFIQPQIKICFKEL